MARGGYRPGAGRPKGSRSAKTETKPKTRKAVPADVAEEAKAADLSPLDYMLRVMNDRGADDSRRDRMAIAAAPFVHARAEAKAGGKKEQQAEAAKSAGAGSEWGDDLAFTGAAVN